MAARANLRLHPGQMKVYRSKARFKVVVAGRRWGKCLKNDSIISMADGSEKRVQDIVPGDAVLAVNEDNYRLEPRQVQHVLDNGIKETLTVRTAGRLLHCTPNHPLLVNNRWVEAGNIKPGDLVAVPKHLAFGNIPMPQHIVDYLAIWLAEGASYKISNGTSEILKVLDDAIAEFGEGLTRYNYRGVDHLITNGKKFNPNWTGAKNPARTLLENLNLWDKTSKTKFIPEAIFALPKAQLARFLNLFFACDGNISKRSKNTWSLEVGLANENMVRQIAKLLHKFGIRGAIRYKRHKAVSRVTGKSFESWTFVCSRPEEIRIFSEEIGILSKERALAEAVRTGEQSRGTCNSYLPISHDEFVGHLVYMPVEKGKYGGHNYKVARDLPEALRSQLTSWRKQTPVRMSTYRYEALRPYSDGYFDPIADGDLAWEEVVSVEPAEPAQTWDLTIEGNHNFIAEGIVTHNTQLSKISIIKMAQIRKRKIWYVAPTYRMAQQIMWSELREAIPKRWIRKINETRMSILLVNGTLIELKGADKPDSLRGVGLHYLVLDEFQDMTEETWTQVLRPTLADTGGHMLAIGTPKSYNHLYSLWKLGQDAENVKHGLWESWQFPTITSPFIPRAEIEAARRDMDAKSFNQEFLASFEVMAGRVYYAFDRSTHVGHYPFNPALPIWVGQDFNIDPMSSVILQPQDNGEIWAVDEIVLPGSNTSETCDELEKRYWRYLKNITVYPDPAGTQRQHARGESDLDIFREKGFKRLKYRKKHPPVADRINAVNRKLMSADGAVKFRVNSTCRHTIEALEQTIYKKGTRDVDKTAGVEHAADALGYAIELEFPVRKIEFGGLSL